MRYLFFLLSLTVTSCAQQVYDFHSIPIGVVRELKVLNAACDIWIRTDLRQYMINGCFDLDIGDTLFEYFVNGKRLYVGKKFDKNLFRITSLF